MKIELSVKNLNFAYRGTQKKVLNQINFQMRSGESICIAGPNGSGKSTFLKVIAGFLRGFSGEVNWSVENILHKNILEWSPKLLAAYLGFVPQAMHTLFPITVYEFVLQGMFPLNELSKYSVQSSQKTKSILDKLEISFLSDRFLNEISTGEVQLALLARALVRGPNVLILDESISNLDFSYLSKVYSVLEDFKKSGVSILMASHDLNLAAEFCDQILFFKEGSILTQGTAKEVLTIDCLEKVYCDSKIKAQLRLKIAQNPFTSKPKIFWV